MWQRQESDDNNRACALFFPLFLLLVSFSVVTSEHQDMETTTATFITELDKIFSDEDLESDIQAKKNILLNK